MKILKKILQYFVFEVIAPEFNNELKESERVGTLERSSSRLSTIMTRAEGQKGQKYDKHSVSSYVREKVAENEKGDDKKLSKGIVDKILYETIKKHADKDSEFDENEIKSLGRILSAFGISSFQELLMKMRTLPNKPYRNLLAEQNKIQNQAENENKSVQKENEKKSEKTSLTSFLEKSFEFTEEEAQFVKCYDFFSSSTDGIKIGLLYYFRLNGHGRVILHLRENRGNKNQPSVKYFGLISRIRRQTIIPLKREPNAELALLCFNIGEEELEYQRDNHTIFGTFSGIESDNNQAICGIFAMTPTSKEFQENIESDKFPKPSDFSPKLSSILSAKRNFVEKGLIKLNEADGKDIMPDIKRLVEQKYWKVSTIVDAATIHFHYIKINPSLTIKWNSATLGLLEGRVEVIENDSTFIVYIKTGINQRNWCMYLRFSKEKSNEIYGCYIGMRRTGNFLNTGLVNFTPVNEETFRNLPEKRKLEREEGESFHIAYRQIEMNCKEVIEDKYTNRLHNKNLIGKYQLLYLNQAEYKAPNYKAIHLNIIEFFADGVVLMKSKNLKDAVYHGYWYLVGNIMYIHLEVDEKKAMRQLKVYFIADLQQEIISTSGVYSVFTVKGNFPISGREFMFRLPDNENKEPDIIKMFTRDYDMLKKQLKEKYDFDISIFNGSINNYIQGKKNAPFKNELDFGKIFFNAAWGVAKQNDKITKEVKGEILFNLRLAFEHGYRDKKQLNKEIEEGGVFHEMQNEIKIESFTIDY